MPDYIVRYGAMRTLGVFSTTGDQRCARAMEVIARTDRGLEAGEVLTEATEAALAGLRDSPPRGQILREMTADDANEISRLHEQRQTQYDICQKNIEKLGLPMHLVDVEYVFGGERIVVYYLADGRVDFRELVRTLASEFQTRIEMRQIGVRDEAKLMADYGDCGNPVCCNNHLAQMPPVSMKMAKLQKATLDPTKISGRCGRLKCCLRYEYETYEHMLKELPPIGSQVETPDGPARVLGHEILAAQLLVDSGDHVRKLVHLADAKPIKAEEPTQDATEPKPIKAKEPTIPDATEQ